MNIHKTIHLVLVALLCYGQMVTSMHAVEHVEQPTEIANCLLLDGCASIAHDHSGNSHDAHVHPVLPDGSDSHAEHDCAIYHVYSNLNGVLLADAQIAHRAELSNSISSSHSGFATAFDFKQYVIRAPPTIS